MVETAGLCVLWGGESSQLICFGAKRGLKKHPQLGLGPGRCKNKMTYTKI